MNIKIIKILFLMSLIFNSNNIFSMGGGSDEGQRRKKIHLEEYTENLGSNEGLSGHNSNEDSEEDSDDSSYSERELNKEEVIEPQRVETLFELSRDKLYEILSKCDNKEDRNELLSKLPLDIKEACFPEFDNNPRKIFESCILLRVKDKLNFLRLYPPKEKDEIVGWLKDESGFPDTFIRVFNHKVSVNQIIFSATHPYIFVSADSNGTINVWDMSKICQKDECIKSISLSADISNFLFINGYTPNLNIDLSPDGCTLAVSIGGMVYLWDILNNCEGCNTRNPDLPCTHPKSMFYLAEFIHQIKFSSRDSKILFIRKFNKVLRVNLDEAVR